MENKTLMCGNCNSKKLVPFIKGGSDRPDVYLHCQRCGIDHSVCKVDLRDVSRKQSQAASF